ncbi:MAG TPA: hypothetical protein QF753_16615 [Victivallales bacterium]|nr:hypothetical protein [Victivallales bacterium]
MPYTSNCQQIIKHKELEEYSIYTEGKELIGLVAETINKRYALPLWVEEWYNFV